MPLVFITDSTVIMGWSKWRPPHPSKEGSPSKRDYCPSQQEISLEIKTPPLNVVPVLDIYMCIYLGIL